METITPLAEKLQLELNLQFARFDYKSMVKEVVARRGVVLICWQREYLPEIAEEILGKKKIAPQSWPEDRFDMIWVFDLDRRTTTYKFKQVAQKLLMDDSGNPIR